MTYHIFSVRQGYVFWREILSVLIIRVFEFGTLCGLEENFSMMCNSEQYERHFWSCVAYCQDMKVFPRAQIFFCHILCLSCSIECKAQCQFYIPTFWVSHDFTLFSYDCGQIPIRTMFPRFYSI